MATSVVLRCFLLIVTSVYVGRPSTSSEVPKMQETMYWCADIDCLVPISEGRTSLSYHAPANDHLTFGKNQEVTILSKPLDGFQGHWIGRIRGKVGKIPVNLVKELKMLGRFEHGYKYPLSELPSLVFGKSVQGSVDASKPSSNPPEPHDHLNLLNEPHFVDVHDHDHTESESPPQLHSTDQVTEASKVDVTHHEHVHENPLLSGHIHAEEHHQNNVVLDGTELPTFEADKPDQGLIDDSNLSSNDPEPDDRVNVLQDPVENAQDHLQTSESPSELLPTEQVTEESSADLAHHKHVHENPLLSDHLHSAEHYHTHGDHHQHSENVKLEPSELPSFATDKPDEVLIESSEISSTDKPDQGLIDASEELSSNHSDLQDHTENSESSPELLPTDQVTEGHTENSESSPELLPTDQVTEEPTEEIVQHDHVNENPLPSDDLHSGEHDHTHGDHHQHIENVNVEPSELPPVATDKPDQVLIESSEISSTDKSDQGLIDASEELSSNHSELLYHTENSQSEPELLPTDQVTEEPTMDIVQHEHVHENPLLAGHSHAEEHYHEHGDQHKLSDNVKLEESEIPSFATEDPVPDPIDATEHVPPTNDYPDNETPKVDLVGRHKHLNPLLHPHSEEHDDGHVHHHNHHHHHEPTVAEGSSFVIAIQHLSSTLVNFLPEYLQDTILDVNDALVFTGIIALTLISICVPYFFIETFLSVRPLKKKVTELNKNLWKVSTAYENQQEEYDVFKKKALAYDEDKKRIEQLEFELRVIKELESKHKDQIKQQQKELKYGAKVALQVENLVGTTMDERNTAVEERDKLKTVVVSLQASLKETTEELEAAQADAATTQMDLELITHTKENLELKVKAVEAEMIELKQKVLSEVELRRSLQLEKDQIGDAKDSLQDELTDLKEILQKYEDTVSDLNQELSLKENELSALKETLGDDSPLIDIAEMTARLQVAESQATSLQSRVESVSLENTSLNRNYEQTKVSLKTLQAEKDQAETRLQVLESYFKEKEEELRTIVEKYEVEKNIRGKDKDELVLMIEEKNDEVKDLSSRLEKLKEEFEQTKLAHRNEIRALEAKSHENWLSLCQSERKAQDIRKESELLRQKLTAVAKGKEAESNDARSSNGDVLSPFMFSQLELEEVPLPIMPDESTLPSYFGLGEDFYGLGGDFEPPAPLDDDEEDADDTLNSRQGREREPQRPPPLGRLSPTLSDNEPDMSPIILPRGGREDYSDGSSSPLHNRSAASRGNWMNGNGTQSTPTRRRGPQQTSSPIQHGLNL